jgi:hypothetical protein
VDSYISLGFIGTKKFVFNDIGDQKGIDKPLRKSKIVFSSEIYLDPIIIHHSRMVYGLLDLLGEVGGEIQFVQMLCAFFIGSYNQTSFVFKVIKQTDYSKQEKKLTKSFCNKMGLQMLKSMGSFRSLFPKKIKKLKKLHDECSDRLEYNLDIVNIIEMIERTKDVKKEES